METGAVLISRARAQQAAQLGRPGQAQRPAAQLVVVQKQAQVTGRAHCRAHPSPSEGCLQRAAGVAK